jgi:hypothetical protein
MQTLVRAAQAFIDADDALNAGSNRVHETHAEARHRHERSYRTALKRLIAVVGRLPPPELR